MQPLSFTTLLAALALVRARPADTADEVSAANDAEQRTCVITGYKSGNCNPDTASVSYKYGTDGCRSCRQFDGCHSFYVSEGCPRGTFEIYSQDDCSIWGDKDPVDFKPGKCFNVDTGGNWNSGYPCFA